MGNNLVIDLSKPVKLTFIKLFGFQKVDVKSHSPAWLGAMGRAIGAAPLGINENITLELLQDISIKGRFFGSGKRELWDPCLRRIRGKNIRRKFTIRISGRIESRRCYRLRKQGILPEKQKQLFKNL